MGAYEVAGAGFGVSLTSRTGEKKTNGAARAAMIAAMKRVSTRPSAVPSQAPRAAPRGAMAMMRTRRAAVTRPSRRVGERRWRRLIWLIDRTEKATPERAALRASRAKVRVLGKRSVRGRRKKAKPSRAVAAMMAGPRPRVRV